MEFNFLNASPVPMVLYKERIIYANKAFFKMSGYNEEDLNKKYVWDLFEENAKAPFENGIQNRLINKMPNKEYSYKFYTKSNDVRWMKIGTTTVLHNGEYLGFATLFDITDKMDEINFKDQLIKLNTELKESKLRYQSLFENNPEICFSLDLYGYFHKLNKVTERVSGYKVEELIGKSIYSFIDKNEYPIVNERFSEVLQGNSVSFYTKIVHKDSHLLDMNVTAVPIIVDHVVIGIIGYAIDITKQKKIEMDLIESEKRYRFITENSTDIISRHDADGTIVYISPIVENILGYTPGELMDRFVENPPKTRSIINLVDHRALNLKKGEIYTFSFEMQKKNGNFIFLESTIKAFYDQEENKIAGFIAVSRDITERKLFEEKLQRTNEFLKQLSTMDGLTGIANRRRFDEFMEIECARSKDSGLPISLIMFDIDFFKLYNDTYGHQAGDDCLKLIASTISLKINRSSDLFARYGGEEFAIVLPGTDLKGAAKVAEKVRKAVEDIKILHSGSKVSQYVTISVGVVSSETVNPEPKSMIVKADDALYCAKNLGRNRTVKVEKV